MLPWWGWLLLWSALVVGGGVLLGLRVRTTWRSLRALTAEVSRAADTVAALEARAERLREDVEDATAVTQDPHRLREEYRTRRAEQVAERAVRRSGRMPRWARVD